MGIFFFFNSEDINLWNTLLRGALDLSSLRFFKLRQDFISFFQRTCPGSDWN